MHAASSIKEKIEKSCLKTARPSRFERRLPGAGYRREVSAVFIQHY